MQIATPEVLFKIAALIAILGAIAQLTLLQFFEIPTVSNFLGKGARTIIASAFGIWIAIAYEIDAVGMLLLATETTKLGMFITGVAIGGGSKYMHRLYKMVKEYQNIQKATTFKIMADGKSNMASK